MSWTSASWDGRAYTTGRQVAEGAEVLGEPSNRKEGGGDEDGLHLDRCCGCELRLEFESVVVRKGYSGSSTGSKMRRLES